MVSETRLAYYAGLFDGEGCVFIKKVKYAPRRQSELVIACQWRSLQLDCSINLTDPTILIELHKVFGGQFRRAKTIKLCGRRHIFTWKLVSMKAVPFLQSILPYSVMKKEQIKLALEFQDRLSRKLGRLPRIQWKKMGHSITDEEYAIRLGIKERLRELKWLDFPVDMSGIAPNSGNAEMRIPSQTGQINPVCVETKRRSQSLLSERQEIVHPNGN